MSKRQESHRQALRQLLDRYCIDRPDREKLIAEILRVGDRFAPAPHWLNEALNSGDGTYKP